VTARTQLKQLKGCTLTGQAVYQTEYSLSSAVAAVATVTAIRWYGAGSTRIELGFGRVVRFPIVFPRLGYRFLFNAGTWLRFVTFSVC